MKKTIILIMITLLSSSLFANKIVYIKDSNIEIETSGFNSVAKTICLNKVLYWVIGSGYRGYMSPVVNLDKDNNMKGVSCTN